MKTGAVVQARTTSTRLPRKILMELPFGSGITVLEQVIRRLKKSEYINEIIVATTINKEDDDIVEISEREGVKHFRGSESDVLSRYYHAAKENSLDFIVRITSDCPCIDPDIIDQVIESHVNSNADYTSNTLEHTFPRGFDTEVFSFQALKKSYKEGTEDFEKEHVTPYMYKSGGFRTQNIEAPEEFRNPCLRITLDTKEDYALLCAVFDFLYPSNPLFGYREIIDLFKRKPWLKLINENVFQKKIFNSLEEELMEAQRILDLQDLRRARDYVRRLMADKI